MPFTVEDFESVAEGCLRVWASALDGDWSAPAGTLEWSCFQTADHTIDCVFSYALFLGSRRTGSYPPFDLLRALPEATPADLVDGLRAVSNMLAGTIRSSPPDVRAVITQSPLRIAPPQAFAARGALELALHTHDIGTGLGVPYAMPDAHAGRLAAATAATADDPDRHVAPLADDPWATLLARSGR